MQTTSINVISKTASSFHAVNFQRAGAPSRLRRRQWQRSSSSPAATAAAAAMQHVTAEDFEGGRRR